MRLPWLCTDQLDYIYRLKPAQAAESVLSAWDTVNYIKPLSMPRGQVVRVPDNHFMMVRVLSVPVDQKNIEINGFTTKRYASEAFTQPSKFYDAEQAFGIAHTNNLRNKKLLINALKEKGKLEIFRQNTVGLGDSSLVGHFVTAGASASLFQGGFNFEPYYLDVSDEPATWASEPRGGVMVEPPAKNILGAGSEDLFTPWPIQYYVQSTTNYISYYANTFDEGTFKKKLFNRELLETPHDISSAHTHERSFNNWNEVYYAPVVGEGRRISSASITGMFVYTPEDDWTQWPDALKIFYKLAELNKLPLIIVWNQ